MDNLYAYSLLLVIFVGLSIVLATSEIGWQLGVRADGRGGNNISALEQSLLGLLALMIGFTFLMALTRFEERREAVLNEANAIGTTALRARLLSEPHRTEILKLLREYAQIRIDYFQAASPSRSFPLSLVARMQFTKHYGSRQRRQPPRTTTWCPLGFLSKRSMI